MADNAFGDFFLNEVEEELEEEEPLAVPVIVPIAAPTEPAVSDLIVEQPAPPDLVSTPAVTPTTASREQRLADALNRLMDESPDVQAAALVSIDGFTMASALPEGMQEDRVGAMSAAILGLGERAAAELGRGQLTQVFIEGAGGYVMLIAAGSRAVLTCLADMDAKLGLVLYDMRAAAAEMAEILG